jgi:hypothetical protein
MLIKPLDNLILGDSGFEAILDPGARLLKTFWRGAPCRSYTNDDAEAVWAALCRRVDRERAAPAEARALAARIVAAIGHGPEVGSADWLAIAARMRAIRVAAPAVLWDDAWRRAQAEWVEGLIAATPAVGPHGGPGS